MDDEALMLQYRAGDAAAFETLYLRHKGPVYRYLRRQLGSAAITDELFQDVWMRVIQARERYEVKALFRTWLYRIAHNRLVDYYRRQSVRAVSNWDEEVPDVDELPGGEWQEPEHEADVQRQVDCLREVLAELPSAQREAFLMREETGFGVIEIAEATGVSRETAKSRLRYAMARLRRGMAERLQDS